jgi:hypothetical protein
MEESKRNNSVFLRGSVTDPRFSHVTQESFFQFLPGLRLSRHRTTYTSRSALWIPRTARSTVRGRELRSFNNKSRSKLVITVSPATLV